MIYSRLFFGFNNKKRPLDKSFAMISRAALLAIVIIVIYAFYFVPSRQKPKLTVFIVVDQMAFKYLEQIKPFVLGGFAQLLNKGLRYDNAHIGHAMPSTAPGHAAFNMGSYPSDHGIIGNKWIDEKTGQKVACDQDARYQLFFSDGTLSTQEGKSPHHINGLGLSESCVLSSSNKSKFHVYSISGKSRSAICTANKLGKPLWFDEFQGGFISSTYYFEKLPDWLVAFNKKNDISALQEYTWKPYFDLVDPAYDFPFHDNYEFAAPKHSFINQTYPLDTANSFRSTKQNPSKGRLSYLQNTPFLNERIFQCAQTVVENTIVNKTNDQLLLWLSLSSLDKVGHIMGPSSTEVLDILYHLDHELKLFFDWVDTKIGLSNTLIVLSSDHGMTDIPEISFKKSILEAERIEELAVVKDLNGHIFDLFGIQDTIKNIMGLQLHLNTSVLHHHKRKDIEKALVSYLKTKPYIHDAWRTKKLKKYASESVALAFKRQTYSGRTGQIMFQLKNHKLITHYPDGASHESPYSDDTHIPLIFYQKGITRGGSITELVFAQQIANSLASIIGVPQVQSGQGRILSDFFSSCNAMQGVNCDYESKN